MGVNEALVPERLYTLAEAADYLRVSRATVRRWIKQHRLPARKVGRDYRIFGEELEKAIDSDAALEQNVRLFTPDNPLMKLIGIGNSGHTDIAEEHDRYLAEWTDERE